MAMQVNSLFRSLAIIALLLTSFAFGSSAQAAEQHSTTKVSMLSDGSAVQGAWSKLQRNDSSVSTTLHTSKLPSGHAVTMWWLVFNHPEHCTNGSGTARCGDDDLLMRGGDQKVEGTVLRAAGHVIGGSGVGNYGAKLSVGDTSGVLMSAGPGLTNPQGAEIHLVVRTHGPAIPKLIDEQLSTFGGGCNNVPPGTGTPGPNTCKNLQIAVHKP